LGELTDDKKTTKTKSADGNSAVDTDNVDRVVLRGAECRRADAWVKALNKRFDGMIRVTKSDLANFLIRQHNETLSEDEVVRIEAELYDEVRWLNWALTKIRKAKREGVVLTLDELMVKRKTNEPSKKLSKKYLRKSANDGANDHSSSNKESDVDPNSVSEI
jgi:hypothetical protein